MSTTLYVIDSCKTHIELRGTLAEAIAAANASDAELQPFSGTWVQEFSRYPGYDDQTGIMRYATDWPEFRFATDGESGVIKAMDFEHACELLDAMFTPQILADGGTGWVEDGDGERYTIGG